MKFFRTLALLLVIGMLFVGFTGCGKKDDDNNSSGGVVSGAVSGAVSEGEKVVSGMESGAESLMSGAESKMESHAESKAESKANSDEGSLESGALTANVGAQERDFSKFNQYNNEKHGWGQGKDVDADNRPISCLEFGEKYRKLDALFIGDVGNQTAKNVYFTFDEGYENGYTPQILDILKEKKCPAVFFVTMPYVKENPDLIKRMIAEGHVVGNHTVNHPSMPTITAEKAAEEISVLHHYMEENFNYTMTLFRPPMGEWSERTLAVTQDMGYKSVFWSFSYKDWEVDNQPESSAALAQITGAAHNGAIYLLHAVSSTNTGILGEVIDGVRSQGFSTAKMV